MTVHCVCQVQLSYYFNGLYDSSFKGMAGNVYIRTVDYQVQIHVAFAVGVGSLFVR